MTSLKARSDRGRRQRSPANAAVVCVQPWSPATVPFASAVRRSGRGTRGRVHSGRGGYPLIRQFDRRRSVFVRLLISLFLVFFAVTLVTGITNYVTVRSALAEQAYERNLEILRQTSRVIETVLDATERATVRLAHNRIVQSVALADWATIEDHYPALLQVRGMLEDELASSIYTHSVFLVSPMNERVLSPSGILRYDEYPDTHLLRVARDRSAPSSWVGPRVTTRIDGRRANVITLLMDVPAGPLDRRGLLIVNLDERLFYDTVISRKQANVGSLAIMNENSVVLSTADKSLLTERLTLAELYPPLQGISEGYAVVREQAGARFVSLITSPYNGWQYVSSAPYDHITAPSRGILLLSVAMSLLFLCLGLGLSVVVSRRFYRPIQTLMNLIGAPDRQKDVLPGSARGSATVDEFEVIHASIDTLLRENREYQARYVATDAILREHFLVDLILGRTRDRSDVRREALAFGLDLAARHFTVIVLRIVPDALGRSGYDTQLRRLRYRVYGTASGVLNRYARGFVVDFGKTDVVICVLSDSHDPLAVCRTVAASTRAIIATDLGIDTSFGIGTPESDHDGLSTSYERAILALEYADPSASGSIIAMDDVVSDVQVHSVIIAYRKQIDDVLYAFRQQEYQKAVELAGTYASAVLADRHLGRLHATMLMHELLSAFLSLLVSFDLDLAEVYGEHAHLFHDFALKKGADEVRQWMISCFSKAAGHLAQRSTIRRRDFVGRIERFVAEHSSDPVGLSDAAEYVHMNRQYFCSIFKAAFGTTFGEYLTEHRLRAAVELLETTNHSIAVIAERAGFSSARSFVRAFRVAKGTTPTKYRLSLQTQVSPARTNASGSLDVRAFANTRT